MPEKDFRATLFCLIAGLFLWCGFSDAHAKPGKTEAQLIEMLKSSNPEKIMDALDRLPKWYPDSTNAIHEITLLLRSRPRTGSEYPPNILIRRAARALGDYGAQLDWDDLTIIAGLLRAQDANEVTDGLKALRGIKAPQEIQYKIVRQILPLLQDRNNHIVRDACRTLAVHGTKDIIPALEPLTMARRADVRKDTKDAIATLESKR